MLLGRAQELERVEHVLESVVSGSGRAILVQGEAGMGKSSLLDEATALAASRGLQVMKARGGELERDFGFGIARQLLERPISALPPKERREVVQGAALIGASAIGFSEDGAPVPSGDPAAMQHGLYWLTSNLAERKPVLLCVDDAQWADTASLRWLLYLSRRLDDLPVSVVVAARLEEPTAAPPEMDLFAREPLVDSFHLEPLNVDAVGFLVREGLGDADPSFVRACLEVTRGNPYLVNELTAAAREEGLGGLAADAVAIEGLTPKGLARNVLVRAARGGREAVALAQAVAVGGPEVELRHAAAVARLPLEAARASVDALVRATILTGGPSLSFVHPLVRTAIYDDVPPARRATMHRSFAQLLYDEGHRELAPMHLMSSERSGDPWIVARLMESGNAALSRGAPREAIALLERALQEGPAEPERAATLMILGRAEAAAGDIDRGARLLDQVVRSASDPALRFDAVLLLSTIITLAGRSVEATDRLRAALADPPDVNPRLILRAKTQLASLARGYQPFARAGIEAVNELQAQEIDESTLEGRLALGVIAVDKAFRNEPADEVADLALRAVAGDAPVSVEEFLHTPALVSLILTDRLDEAETVLERFATQARSRGSVLAWTVAWPWVAFVHRRRGDLVRAEAEASLALDVAREHRVSLTQFFAPMLLAEIALEHDDADRARALLDESADHGLGEAAWSDQVRFFRAVLALRSGDAEGALAELLDLGRGQVESLLACPAVLPWRSTGALAALFAGKPELARELAAEERELARAFGAPRPLGVALRVSGIVGGRDEGLEYLREAVEVLAGSHDRLEEARARVDLGAALRRAGQRAEARELLELGLQLAGRCGATKLAERAQRELEAAGARQGRRPVSGPASLTPSERRVAELAAAGQSNTEIAQALFLSRRTVESHLQSAYRKLGTSSRAELRELRLGP